MQPKLSAQQQAKVRAMLNASRSAADPARLFRGHHAIISRAASSASDENYVASIFPSELSDFQSLR